jgi:hypothetical protein
VGLLDGDIAALFGSVMGEFYLPATLRKVTLVTDGYGGGTETVTTESVRIQEDLIKEEVRAQMGYTQDTKRFLILQSSVSGPVTGDSELTHDGVTYMLQKPEQDPAKSYWSVIGVPK